MSENLAGQTVAAFGSLFGAVVVLGFVFMIFYANYLMFSALRNVKLIRLEFQRLNEILESRLSLDTPTLPRR